MRHDSNLSSHSSCGSGGGGGRDGKKKTKQGRAAARQRKFQAQSSDIEIGHIVDYHDEGEVFSMDSLDETLETAMSADDNKKRLSFLVKSRLDKANAAHHPFKKKLMLNDLNLTASDIPIEELCGDLCGSGTVLGNSLHKLSLSGNGLGVLPPKLVQSLPMLKTLDLSQCKLHELPKYWDLPKLTFLNLSLNFFSVFPEEVSVDAV